MEKNTLPEIFMRLLSGGCINQSDVLKTTDNFWMVYKSLSDILSKEGIVEFSDSEGERFKCSSFYDDWFLYAVPTENDYTYGLLKLREQEHDAKEGSPADGDTPGVTISFISFSCEVLLECIANPSEENTIKLSDEINRVVACRGQRHNKDLKRYFISAKSEGAYLAAAAYVDHIASFSQNGYLDVPEHYKEIAQRALSCKAFSKWSRLPLFVESLNRKAGYVVCDNERICIKNKKALTEWESAAILATHTGNTSIYSFAAEVEYHAKFLTPLAKIKIPFFKRSIYDSAIRADMSIGDAEFQGPAPFYRESSGIVKRQYRLHSNKEFWLHFQYEGN